MNYIAFVLLILCALWVYRDASQLNARAKQQELNINLQPVPWALLTLAVWIAFFPLYLYNRHQVKRMLEPEISTGTFPMKSPNLKIWIVLLCIVIAGGWAAWSYLTRLPDCSNEETLALLNDIVRIELAGTDKPQRLEHFNALVKVEITAIETLEHTKDPERYQCAATVNVDLGQEVRAAMGMSQEMIDNPNLLTALVMGPLLKEVYGPLEGLRVKFTSTWAKEKGETRHYVAARLSNPGATGYADLTEAAWAQMQARSAAEKAAPPPTKTEPMPAQPPMADPVPAAPQAIKAPETSNTETPMPGRSIDVRTTVQNLSAAWLQAMSDAQTGDQIAALYADQVDFYGKPNVKRTAIAKEKAAFIRRWTERRYQANGRPALISSNADTAIWVQSFSYKVTDGQKTNSGQSTLEFTAKRIGNEWLIVAEKKAE